MESPVPAPQVLAESARALCRGRGGPLGGHQKTGCSARCRARVSRRWRADLQGERDAEIRALLEMAFDKLRRQP